MKFFQWKLIFFGGNLYFLVETSTIFGGNYVFGGN